VKYLREIAQIVTRYREKNPDLMDFEPSLDDPDMTSKLYLGLRDGKITTDLAAAEYLYGSPTIDTKYTTLKNRLKKKLINLLFFLDIREKDFSEQLVARYQNLKVLFWANTVSTFGARNSGIKLYESALKQALQYDMTLNALQCTIMLRNYSRFSGSERQYNKYDTLTKQLTKDLDIELRAQELYERITIRFSRSIAEQPDLKDICSNYLSQLETLKTQCDTFTFNLYYYRVKITSLGIEQKFIESVKVCDEAISYLDKNVHKTFSALYGEFGMHNLTSYLSLGDYKKGNEAAEKCLAIIPAGLPNWFLVMEYRLLLATQSIRFSEAEAAYIQAVQHPRFQFLPEETKEKWQLFELYLDFAMRQTSISSSRTGAKRIDPKRYLDAVPNYKKDKRGYNIAILILQILLLLEQNDFSSIIGRMDALRTYRNRYLQVSTNRRSALFFKMLQIMEANSFDPKITQSKASTYLERMSHRTSDAVEAQDGIQILPFEWLWQTIIKMLEEKQRQGRI
jgi:hypothetical protein